MQVDVEGLGENLEEEGLPVAWYKLRCDKAYIATTKDGDPMLKVEETIVDGPDLPSGDSPAGRKVFGSFVHPRADMKDGGNFANKKLTNVITSYGAMFIPGKGYDPDDLVGKEAWGKVLTETYEDEPTLRVKKYKAIE